MATFEELKNRVLNQLSKSSDGASRMYEQLEQLGAGETAIDQIVRLASSAQSEGTRLQAAKFLVEVLTGRDKAGQEAHRQMVQFAFNGNPPVGMLSSRSRPDDDEFVETVN